MRRIFGIQILGVLWVIGSIIYNEVLHKEIHQVDVETQELDMSENKEVFLVSPHPSPQLYLVNLNLVVKPEYQVMYLINENI